MSGISISSHYEVLEVKETATLAEIRKAYRQKALKHHPDKNSTEHATQSFQRIQQAYEILGSARKRSAYDATGRNDARNEAAISRVEQEREQHRSLVQSRLIEACKAGATWDTMKLLRGGCSGDVNAFDDDGLTALMHAAKGGFIQVLSLLVLYKAEINLANSSGWTALIFAANSLANLQDDAIKEKELCSSLLELLKAKANPDAKTQSGLTALLMASGSGCLDMTQALLDLAADTNVVDHAGMTALHLAAEGGHVSVVRALLKSGASIDVPDQDGRTALMFASSYANEDVVSELLEAAADPCAKAVDGSSALLFAMECLWDVHLALHQSKKDRTIALVSMLLQARANPEEAAEDGRTPVALASQIGDSDVVTLLQGRHCEETCHDQMPSASRVAELGG